MWKKLLVGVIVLGTVGAAGAWMLGYFSEDPALAGVRDLQAKLADENLKDEDRRAVFQQMRTQMESLSPEARRTVWEGNRQRFEQRFDARMNQILAMVPAERTKALDEEIKREEQRSKERAQRQNDRGGQAGGNGANAGPPGGRRGANLSDAERVNRMRSRLERSTPEQRAKREMYRRLMDDRRKQLGLAPGGPGRGFGRG